MSSLREFCVVWWQILWLLQIMFIKPPSFTHDVSFWTAMHMPPQWHPAAHIRRQASNSSWHFVFMEMASAKITISNTIVLRNPLSYSSTFIYFASARKMHFTFSFRHFEHADGLWWLFTMTWSLHHMYTYCARENLHTNHRPWSYSVCLCARERMHFRFNFSTFVVVWMMSVRRRRVLLLFCCIFGPMTLEGSGGMMNSFSGTYNIGWVLANECFVRIMSSLFVWFWVHATIGWGI